MTTSDMARDQLEGFLRSYPAEVVSEALAEAGYLKVGVALATFTVRTERAKAEAEAVALSARVD